VGEPAAGKPMEILSVSQVTRHIGQLIGADPILRDVWIRGEITNLTRSTAGHYYFSLRDPAAQLRCVLFRAAAARLGAVPQQGASVILHGKIAFFEPTGVCEVGVDLLYPAGVGVERLQLEALKLKLRSEGLFARERKRPLPPFPRRIGLVTSDGSAALHDVLHVLRRRYPLGEVVLAPASVQGERAPIEICAALDRLAREHQHGKRIDVAIVARGGGSEDELAVFNDERLARAFFGFPVPIVSAVGHERDITLVDYIADLRAPTPSAAAELVAPDVADLRKMTSQLAGRGHEAALRSLQGSRYQMESSQDRLRSRSPVRELARGRMEVRALLERGLAAAQQRVGLARETCHGRALQLEALSPLRTLERGYAICTLQAGAVLRSIYQVDSGQRVDIRVTDGVVSSEATGRRAADGRTSRPSNKTRPASGGSEGVPADSPATQASGRTE
jgi:exodeoxyribonuclease VII large subunit